MWVATRIAEEQHEIQTVCPIEILYGFFATTLPFSHT